MAEIKIEKKANIWPWVLIVILLAALLLYFFVFRDNNESDNVADVDNDTSEQMVANDTSTNDNDEEVVADYVNYINGDAKMGLDHLYTSTALQKLVRAIRAKAENTGYEVNTELDKVNTFADKIQKDPSATTHGNSIHEAVTLLTKAMESLQQAKYPGLNKEMAEVKEASNGIAADTQTLQQKESVRTFFEKAAHLLQNMH